MIHPKQKVVADMFSTRWMVRILSYSLKWKVALRSAQMFNEGQYTMTRGALFLCSFRELSDGNISEVMSIRG